MLNIKDEIFGKAGYSTKLRLTPQELETFRYYINKQWLSVINELHPELSKEASELGIENYHKISNRIDHKKCWPKANRILPQLSVNELKKLPFISKLTNEFGHFEISDAYDTKQHHGKEEIYWRLVRPHAEGDIGPLHKDKWFHGALNSGYGMFPEDVITVKIWIPIYCTPGKSGLAIAPGSHLKEWKYHIEIENDVPHPKPDEDLSDAGAQLISTDPGQMLIFNEGTLHGGVINSSDKTRVSAEITMVLKKNNHVVNHNKITETTIE